MLFLLFLITLLPSVQGQGFYSQRSRCPLSCKDSGLNPSNWTYYHNLDVLVRCREPLLLDLNLHNPVEDPGTHLTFRACLSSEVVGAARKGPSSRRQLIYNKNTTANLTTGDRNDHTVSATTTRNVQLAWWGDKESSENHATPDDIVAAAQQLSHYPRSNETLEECIMLASHGGAILGIYVGSQVQKSSAASLIDKFAEISRPDDTYNRYSAQLCGDNSSVFSTTEAFGVVVDTTNSLSVVQKALRSFSQAKCLGGANKSSAWSDMSLVIIPDSKVKIAPRYSNKKDSPKGGLLVARDTCRYTQVVAGDGCWELTQRCGITEEELESYNGGSSFCNSLLVGRYVCCSAGTLPDFSPQPNPDGSCFSYTVQAGDLCDTIASTHSTTADKIESVNSNTWGWDGCRNLQIGMNICLSTGSPPMPAGVPNSICGPQVPGTTPPTNGTALTDLNPCPLNACCDVWGQCGTYPQFCTATQSTTGAPGTAASGTNECISNCDIEITNNVPGDVAKRRITYFEAFSADRSCLHMKASDIVTAHDNPYDHVHYAFGTITTDFNVDVSAYPEMFRDFVKATGIKRIVSFGGWAFSTNASRYQIFRTGVTEANRGTFAKNVVDCLIQNNLDRLDFDWEYPGAPDLPDVPPGGHEEGSNYLEFLKLVEAALPDGRTVSIAAPASYWYLKGFPIAEISKTVDYIVYMTYDLHGQWDYNNTFVNEGCALRSCLRSHVNFTETYYAVAMITKAGVALNKVLIGMARYSRSFEMAEAGCTGPECLFTGPESGAWPGRCTNTSGYISNYEINGIISAANSPELYGTTITKLRDDTADQDNPFLDGDILVYDDTQWISYMSDETYKSRAQHWLRLNVGGLVDWVVDLATDYSDSSPDDGSDADDDDKAPCDFTKKTITHWMRLYPIWARSVPSAPRSSSSMLFPTSFPSPLRTTPTSITTTTDSSAITSRRSRSRYPPPWKSSWRLSTGPGINISHARSWTIGARNSPARSAPSATRASRANAFTTPLSTRRAFSPTYPTTTASPPTGSPSGCMNGVTPSVTDRARTVRRASGTISPWPPATSNPLTQRPS